MFGDNGIYGKSYHTMDTKNRVIIPKDTCVEDKEQMCFYKENEITFSIYSLKTIKKEILRLKTRIQRCKHEDIEKNQKVLNDFIMRIIDYTHVDAQRRMVIPIDIVNEYKLEKNLIFHGGSDHLKIFKDEETYDKYVKSLKKGN